ncbi:hypothetical protein BTA51_26080 [Hahella sp. CCB-MM4]|uniref:carboxymuconolactone decarboxylase family protein n=1 Tax=Hahella sp. (strain CCB-MM4) TaxID=1926491 RepID=UPI000B9A9406|nr:carboxymuconolactone decarboxylase family protein [Hahella sp. CCB-MM4]OZG70440.1 hypothetical protein BTA51_26080 [Hahella sp. CCB-MM4]
MSSKDNERLEHGLHIISQLELPMGNPHGLLHGMRIHGPAFKQHLIESLGRHFSADHPLEDKVKVLLALSLASVSQSDDLIEFFVGAALKLGWSREQVVSTIEVGTLFNGWPSAIGAVQVAISVFEKLDVLEKEGQSND